MTEAHAFLCYSTPKSVAHQSDFRCHATLVIKSILRQQCQLLTSMPTVLDLFMLNDSVMDGSTAFVQGFAQAQLTIPSIHMHLVAAQSTPSLHLG